MQRKRVRCATPIGKESYTVNFRHPVVKDKSGKYGLKVHRGLGTKKPEEAEKMADMLEELIVNDRWHNAALRKEALKEGFPEIIVDAFFDPMNGRVIDNEIQMKKAAVTQEEAGCSKVLIISPNGISGSSLLRWIYKTDEATEIMPCNLDLIMSDHEEYEMVVSLMLWSHLDMYIQENIETALEYCLGCIDKESNEAELCNKLLVHESGAVNLAYIMGDVTLEDKTAEEESEDDPERNITDMVNLIREFLDAVKKIAGSLKDSHISLEDIPDYPEYHNEIVRLRKYMVEEVKKKSNNFKFLNKGEKLKSEGGKGWYYKTRNQEDFFNILKRFTDYSKSAWGTLLTPLVEEICIKGRFQKSSLGDVAEDGVTMDDVPGYIFSERRIRTDKIIPGMPTDLLEDALQADIVLLVDDGDRTGGMAENAKILLRRLVECGKAGRIITAFSRVNMNEGEKRLRDCLDEWEGYTAYAVTDTEKKNICDNCFSVSEGAGAVKYLIQKIDEYNRKKKPEISFCYDELTLFQHLKFAIDDFRDDWAGKLDIRTSKLGLVLINDRTQEYAPPASVKKLTNRMAYYGIDQYNYELMPVADFIQTLSDELNVFINRSEVLSDGVTEEETAGRRNEIKCKINGKIAEFIKAYMWNNGNDRSPVDLWGDAYKCTGKYAMYNRAEKINDILELGAPRISSNTFMMTDIQWDYIMALFDEIEAVLKESGCVFERYIFADED